MDIGEILEVIESRMVELGVSRSELARDLGLSRSTVTVFFGRPRVDMRLGYLERYLDVLGLEFVVREKGE